MNMLVICLVDSWYPSAMAGLFGAAEHCKDSQWVWVPVQFVLACKFMLELKNSFQMQQLLCCSGFQLHTCEQLAAL